MIKIIIADDEKMAYMGMAAILHEIYGDAVSLRHASNGAALVALAREWKPDILFIDIRMPVMDGLKALELIRCDEPDAQCVILSGYAEFEYAQKALSAGAMEYLLKPVGEHALAETIQRAMNNIERTRKARKSDFASCLLLNICSQGKSGPQNASFSPGTYEAYQFCFDKALAEEEMHRAAKSLVEQVKTQFDGCFVVLRPFPESVSLFLNPLLPRQCDSLVREFAAHSRAHALYTSAETLEQLAERYKWLHNAAALRVLHWTKRLNDIPVEEEALVPVARALQCLRESLRGSDAEAFQSSLSSLNALIPSQCLSAEHIRSAAAYLELDPSVDNGPALLRELMGLAEQTFCAKRPKRETLITEKALQYVREHYTEPIDVNSIAQALGITPNYLSSLFRKCTGEKLNDYLTRIRIDRAKELLEKNPQMRVYDVASAVGYGNERYFSRVFQGRVGMTPSLYAAWAQKDGRSG